MVFGWHAEKLLNNILGVGDLLDGIPVGPLRRATRYVLANIFHLFLLPRHLYLQMSAGLTRDLVALILSQNCT